MKSMLFKSNQSQAPLLLRLFLALVLFPHGAQKLIGWFGGFGFEGTMKYFTGTERLPYVIGLLVIVIEFFGPLFILVGLATRLWSLAIIIVMTGVILTNFSTYFFMNWFGDHPEEGMEFFLLAIGMAASLLVSGAGAYSLDNWIIRKTSVLERGRLHAQAA